MRTTVKSIITALLMMLALVGCAKEYQQIQWVDLLPEDDLKALMEDPIPDSILEGSAADRIKSEIAMEIDNPISRYEQALVSVRVRGEFDQRAIKVPGYIVPVETNDEGKATAFFLVPFFGACIHLPPPPPNQIIYATYDKGIEIDDLEIPFWVEATLSTDQKKNELATAAYSATVDKLYPFKDGDDY